MGRFKQNKSKVNKKLNETRIFLNEKCKLKYHQLIMGKPEYDLFIDDKNHNFNKNWSKNLEKNSIFNIFKLKFDNAKKILPFNCWLFNI